MSQGKEYESYRAPEPGSRYRPFSKRSPSILVFHLDEYAGGDLDYIAESALQTRLGKLNRLGDELRQSLLRRQRRRRA